MPSNTDARLLRSAFGGGYGGGGYPMGGRSRVIDLILARGQQQAEQTRANGAMWGDAIKGIGDSIGGAIQQHATEQKEKARDKAWADYVEGGTWANDPKGAYQTALKIGGPDLADKWMRGLAGVSQIAQPKRDEKADTQAIIAVHEGLETVDEPTRARQWGQFVPLLKSRYPDLPFTPEYTPQQWAMAGSIVGQIKPKPESYTLSPGQTRFENGQQVASVPPEVKPQPGFNLSPGEARYDASGNVIATRPPAPKEPKDEPLEAVIGPDGNPVLVRRSQAVNRRPASSREQGRPVVSGDANRVAELDTSLSDLNTLRSQITGATGVRAQIGAALPNVVTEMTGIGSDAKQKQATIDRVKQVIGKALEEGVLRKEDEEKYKKILPTISDPPAVVQAKLDGLAKAIQQKKANLLDSLGDAGYDTSRYRARGGQSGGPHRIQSDAEYDALPSGAVFVGPDGVQRRKP